MDPNISYHSHFYKWHNIVLYAVLIGCRLEVMVKHLQLSLHSSGKYQSIKAFGK